MNKLESLEFLRKHGFNVARYVRWNIDLNAEIISQIFCPNTIGIRTWKYRGTMGSPCLYGMECPKEVYARAKEFGLQGWNVIIQETIPKEWSLIAGNVMVNHPDTRSGLFEYHTEKEIVRAVDTLNPKDVSRYQYRDYSNIKQEDLCDVATEASDISIMLNRAVIVEFSVQDRRCGILDERIVFWEVRDAGQ